MTGFFSVSSLPLHIVSLGSTTNAIFNAFNQ
jgi:hypothetical protein